MAFSLKDWYRNLDSDQKNVLQSTGCSLLSALLLFLTIPIPESLFLSYLVLSYAITYGFSWRNRTKYSKRKFRSKNGKIFSLKECSKYRKFLFIMAPITFCISALCVDRSSGAFYCMFGMTVLQTICSRIYLFHKKIPLRAFTLAAGPGGGYNPRRSSSSFGSSSSSFNSRDVLSPTPCKGNGYGTMGSSSRR